MSLELDRRHEHGLVEHLIEEEAVDDLRLGGNLPLWIGVIIVGLGLLAIGVYNAPSLRGFMIMIGGGLVLGLGYAEVITRLPTLTHRWSMSAMLLLVTSAIVVGVIVLNASAAPVPPPNPDALLTPNR